MLERKKQKTMMREAGYVTVAEASAASGLSVQRIYALVDAGRVAGRRIGGKRYARCYVELSSLRAHLGPDAVGVLGDLGSASEAPDGAESS